MAFWLLQLVGLTVNLIIAFVNDTKKIYWLSFLFNAVNLILYIITNDWAAVLSGTLITLRSFLYIYKDKIRSNWTPVIFCAMHITLGLLFMQTPWQVLTIVAPCTVCLSMWFWKGHYQKLRFGNIVNAGCWLLYNIHTGMCLIAICRVLTLVANVVALYQNSSTKKGVH